MAEDEGLDSLSSDRHSGRRSRPFGVAGGIGNPAGLSIGLTPMYYQE